MNVRHLHSSQHGYVEPGPVYYEQDSQGHIAPPGYAFNEADELVQLPYEPWAEGPQMPWESPDNPDYLAYAQGKATIENQPSADPRVPSRYGKLPMQGHAAPITHQEVTLVPQREYLNQDGDIVPQQDEGTRVQAIFDMPASPVRTRYKLSKEITGYIEVVAPAPGSNSPLQVVPTGTPESAPPVAPFGGAVAIASCQFGHLGTQREQIFDVLPGALVKLPTVTSFLRITGRIVPRYFQNVDTGAPGSITRTYLLFPGGPTLTNSSFSNLPPNIMALQGSGAGTIVAAGAQANPVDFVGWPAQGVSTNPSLDSALPIRIFRGSVLSSAAAPAAPSNRTRIPIPDGATGAILVGGFFDPAKTPASVPITWVQNLDTGATVGPFAANLVEPTLLLQGITSIDVFGGNSAAAGDLDIYFAMNYYINL